MTLNDINALINKTPHQVNFSNSKLNKSDSNAARSTQSKKVNKKKYSFDKL